MKKFSLTLGWDPNKYLRVRVDMEVTAMKGYSLFPSGQEPYSQMV